MALGLVFLALGLAFLALGLAFLTFGLVFLVLGPAFLVLALACLVLGPGFLVFGLAFFLDPVCFRSWIVDFKVSIFACSNFLSFSLCCLNFCVYQALGWLVEVSSCARTLRRPSESSNSCSRAFNCSSLFSFLALVGDTLKPSNSDLPNVIVEPSLCTFSKIVATSGPSMVPCSLEKLCLTHANNRMLDTRIIKFLQTYFSNSLDPTVGVLSTTVYNPSHAGMITLASQSPFSGQGITRKKVINALKCSGGNGGSTPTRGSSFMFSTISERNLWHISFTRLTGTAEFALDS